MVDILFTHSYFLRLDPAQWNAAGPYPPLAALCAAQALRARGRTVAFHDTTLEDSETSLEQALDRAMPRLLVIHDQGQEPAASPEPPRTRCAVHALARIAGRRGVPVVVLGPGVRGDVEEYLREGTDFLVLGDGEAPLVELTALILDGSSGRPARLPDDDRLEAVQGIAFVAEGGHIRRTPLRREPAGPGAPPCPAWDLIDLERYRRHSMYRHGAFALEVVTGRGCPYRCNWCPEGTRGRGFATRPPAEVAEEWAALKTRHGVERLLITDDLFGVDPGWLPRLRDEVRARDAALPFTAQARAEQIDDDAVRALKDLGCDTVWLGAESGSRAVLDAMERDAEEGAVERAAAKLKRAGIRVGVHLQFGFPGEGWREIGETLGLLRRTRPDALCMARSVPVPGSAFHARVATGAWPDPCREPVRTHLFPDMFYRVLEKRVRAEFLVRRAVERRDPRGVLHLLLLPWYMLRLRMLRRPLPGAIRALPAARGAGRGAVWAEAELATTAR